MLSFESKHFIITCIRQENTIMNWTNFCLTIKKKTELQHAWFMYNYFMYTSTWWVHSRVSLPHLFSLGNKNIILVSISFFFFFGYLWHRLHFNCSMSANQLRLSMHCPWIQCYNSLRTVPNFQFTNIVIESAPETVIYFICIRLICKLWQAPAHAYNVII